VAGYSNIYVVGGQGGFMGTDGVNPIECLVLVGDADRQWLEPKYFDRSIKPIGKLRVIVPAGPDQPDSLLDACIAFLPRHFSGCPSLGEVESALRGGGIAESGQRWVLFLVVGTQSTASVSRVH
jgi:hypothetical protein